MSLKLNLADRLRVLRHGDFLKLGPRVNGVEVAVFIDAPEPVHDMMPSMPQGVDLGCDVFDCRCLLYGEFLACEFFQARQPFSQILFVFDLPAAPLPRRNHALDNQFEQRPMNTERSELVSHVLVGKRANSEWHGLDPH